MAARVAGFGGGKFPGLSRSRPTSPSCLRRPRRALIIAAAFASGSGPGVAETLFCSTSFQGYRVCDDGHGYRSTEWQWNGMTLGSDSDGARWTTSPWRDGEITTVMPPER